MSEIQVKDKLITLEELGTAINAKAGVTGVKGNEESTYRTGQVNLTPANIGAVAKSGGTMTGNLNVGQTSDTAERTVKAVSAAGAIYLYSQGTNTGNRGIYTANAAGIGKNVISIDQNNNVTCNGNAANVTDTVQVDHGGTGAITPAGARANLDITPANIGAVATSDIINNLTSTATNKPLSAAQGKVLFDDYYTGRIISQWVTCNYLNSNQLHGFFTKPTAPTGYTLQACFASNLSSNTELGVKCSGGFLIGDNYLRVRGNGFTSTDTIDALLCWLVIKN